MTRLPIYQVDAFTDTPFKGNPAAVVLMEDWPADAVLQSIAAENNLAETAFVREAGEAFELRWFTPVSEVPLCGHATLASAFVLTQCRGVTASPIRFSTRFSGELTVTREGERFVMRLPRRSFSAVENDPVVDEAIGARVVESYLVPVPGDDVLMVVLNSADEVRDLAPDIGAIAKLSWRSVLVTAKGDGEVDFVSRYFAPKFGIPEDPVTGSAHCSLAPLWMEKLGKTRLLAHQLSPRGGTIHCAVEEESVVVEGEGVLFLEGTIVV